MTNPARTARTLYDPSQEHDGCGVGFVARLDGRKEHATIRDALRALARLQHRGAIDADRKTGDGAGVQFELPEAFFRDEYARLSDGHSRHEIEGRLIGAGAVFFDATTTDAVRQAIEEVLERRGLAFAWRPVPVNEDVLGSKALSTLPRIEQLIVVGPEAGQGDDERLRFDRTLFIARKEAGWRCRQHDLPEPYFASLSCRRLVYKGLMLASAVGDFYPDLALDAFESRYCIFHQRFSTNTFPSWSLAQPFDMLGHNGEINTILGNRNGTRLREADLSSDIWGEDMAYLTPVLGEGQSDSAQLDNVVELLALSGRSLPHVMTMLMPAAWEAMPDVTAELKNFYEYHACINEPWDGPAAVVFSDGEVVGATLDRNGLRPARYIHTRDGRVVVSSEVGVVDVDPRDVVERGRLGPGEMILVDLAAQKLVKDAEIKRELANQKPYGQWVAAHLQRLDALPFEHSEAVPTMDKEALTAAQITFGYSAEEARFIFEPMALEATDPIGSMGDDTPLAVLSRLPRLLCTYFKQRFAQVTNPPIDPIREELVMSLEVNLGRRRNWLAETPEHADQIVLSGPVVTESDLDAVRRLTRSETISVLFDADGGPEAMEGALDRICAEAEAAIDAGAESLILSDRGVDRDRAPVPMLLAIGAVNNHLLRVLKRLRVSLIADTGEPREVHHFATLIGYGASAVCPYLAYETIAAEVAGPDADDQQLATHLENYRKALHKGLLKVMSKMGISVAGSYRGAQVFEAIGIGQEVIDRCFTNTPSQVGGIGFTEIAHEALARHAEAFGDEERNRLQDLGFYRYRRNGETHGWSPKMLGAMMKFRKKPSAEAFDKFLDQASAGPAIGVRDLLEFNSDRESIPVDEVEPVESIRQRFTTAAMSLGSLSPEAHEAVAIAMNRIGGKSNTGEGGEDPARYDAQPGGDSASAAIKQVASGRFGVTPKYLIEATELEIKMAQGSKPGEGGQLPGHKVTPYIARLRHATPGVTLISPPPHHDIYSIEDLAQLIYDLKQINPGAQICVKLVAESGVGTIAAGVAKAYADVIQISGHDGGTGASPLSSIKNAGGPWELGLSEAQQVLRMNGLRERVKLRTDGGLKTGRDIVVAAMLGAEEYNFGTAALISIGCRYVRQCHLDTCPVGIATQREELREKFDGNPDQVIAYFNAVATDVRQLLAELGYRSVDELIGRTDLLRQREIADHPKANAVDLSRMLADPVPEAPRKRTWPRNMEPEPSLNDRILADLGTAPVTGRRIERYYRIQNDDRTVGARIAGAIARHHGNDGLPHGSIELSFAGSAGQSFGAFNINGMRLTLSGEANDYVAKGMAGGSIVICPPEQAPARSEDVLVGNTVLYGATGGRLFVAGTAGERFAVRNSGAEAVVEGLGDHGCEYMTRGTVVVLGRTGKNFGAGMTGGTAYVWDPAGAFIGKFNSSFVQIERVGGDDDELRRLVERHRTVTQSPRAQALLDEWDEEARGQFWRVVPLDLAELAETAAEDERDAG